MASIAHFQGHAEILTHADIVLAEAQTAVERRELLETVEDDFVAAEPACFADGVLHQGRSQTLATVAAAH